MTQLAEKTEFTPPNRLISLKVLVFLFFGALQSMYAFLPHHMLALGLKLDDVRTVTLVAGLVSIIGPLLVGLILDRVSVKRPSAYGKWLRVLLFIFFILAGIAFGALLLLEKLPAEREAPKNSNVTFSCNEEGAHVFVRRNNTPNEECIDLNSRTGNLTLVNCTYTCETPDQFEDHFKRLNWHKLQPIQLSDTASLGSSENPTSDYDYDDNLPEPAALVAVPTQAQIIPPPHICARNDSDHVNCHVYLESSVIELSEVEGEAHENTTADYNQDWCLHPISRMSCRIPEAQVMWMEHLLKPKNKTCDIPVVECFVQDPFGRTSLLHHLVRSVSPEKLAELRELYFALRIVAEIFPVIIHMLLNVAIIIATRETSSGRGNVGHQWAFYPIGVLVFASAVGLVNHVWSGNEDRYFVPILTFSVSMFVCAVVVLFSGKLPLTPSDWWWHTKCGMLAIPMSALKRYKWVIAAIAVVALLAGSLWHVYEAFRHLFSLDLIESAIVGAGAWRTKTFAYVIGALLAVPLIWNGEKVVDCLGHSNIFILAFVTFALRFAGLYFDAGSPEMALLEILEPVSFYLPWLTLLLFARHLIPKKLLALGQALLVALFFALGRALGFLYGTSTVADDKFDTLAFVTPESNARAEEADLKAIYQGSAAIACAAAIVYFVVYHGILLPCYRVPTNRLGAANSDSSVSPQRVFHDERSRKGYFRY